MTVRFEQELRMFGPKLARNSSIGDPCPACRTEFKEGDYTTLVTLGPGDDPDAQAYARDGRPYNAVAIEVHWACATGRDHCASCEGRRGGVPGNENIHNGKPCCDHCHADLLQGEVRNGVAAMG